MLNHAPICHPSQLWPSQFICAPNTRRRWCRCPNKYCLALGNPSIFGELTMAATHTVIRPGCFAPSVAFNYQEAAFIVGMMSVRYSKAEATPSSNLSEFLARASLSITYWPAVRNTREARREFVKKVYFNFKKSLVPKTNGIIIFTMNSVTSAVRSNYE